MDFPIFTGEGAQNLDTPKASDRMLLFSLDKDGDGCAAELHS